MPTLVVEISGPNFFQSAEAAAKTLQPLSVGELRVHVGTLSPESPQIKQAVITLQRFLTPGASVYFITDTPPQSKPPASPAVSPIAGGFGLANIFLLPENQMDQRNAQTILTQMQAVDQKQQMERWKIQQDIQTRIFEIQQDVTSNRAKAQDKAYKKWDEYVRG